MSFDFNVCLPSVIANRLMHKDYHPSHHISHDEKFDYSAILGIIMNAYNELVAVHKLGFITYTISQDAINFDSANYGRTLKSYMSKADELQQFSTNEIELDRFPRKPHEILNELLMNIAFHNRQTDKPLTQNETKQVLYALGFLNNPKRTSMDKKLLEIIPLIIKK